jgi:hypothetical protein
VPQMVKKNRKREEVDVGTKGRRGVLGVWGEE